MPLETLIHIYFKMIREIVNYNQSELAHNMKAKFMEKHYVSQTILFHFLSGGKKKNVS